MNAKFEKWFEDNGVFATPEDIWKGAIQSLEVTPELESAAREGWLNHACCNSGCASDDLLNAALKAFLSALKEQAK